MRPLKLPALFALPTLAVGVILGMAMGQRPPNPAIPLGSHPLPPEAQRRVLHLVIRRNYDEVNDAIGTALDNKLRKC